MGYNSVGTPTFYIDAVLLARQWGAIQHESTQGKFKLNPSKIESYNNWDADENIFFTTKFKTRYWVNSLSHCFVLGHNLYALKDIDFVVKLQGTSEDIYGSWDDVQENVVADTYPSFNGYTKYEWDSVENIVASRLSVRFHDRENTTSGGLQLKLGDISCGWSFKMTNSPDLELTQSFINESVKTQTTYGGHTLSNSSYNSQPKWIRQPWVQDSIRYGVGDYANYALQGGLVSPVGRRRWNLKFSFLSHTGLFPEFHNGDSNDNGIFEWYQDENIGHFKIKDDFLSKCYHGSNGFQLPFIFQPDSSVENYAICRVDSDSISFDQVAINTYNCSINLVEVW